jgi:ABC-type phosphate/phosphonate transport system substrate-binding protein
MSPALRAAVESALLEMPKTDAGLKALHSAVLTGIGRARDKDYEPHRKMVQAVMRSDAAAAR